MSEPDFDAYGFGVQLGFASYQLSAGQSPESARMPLVLDALARARQFGERLGNIVEGLDVSALDQIVAELKAPWPSFPSECSKLVSLRDEAYSPAIFAALPRFGDAYVLGVNLAIAEGQVSYYAIDEVADEARKIAIGGLNNSKKWVAALRVFGVALDAQWLDQLLAMFTAGRPSSAIHPRLQTYRVEYGNALRQAPSPA
jgi:hypothetical protein